MTAAFKNVEREPVFTGLCTVQKFVKYPIRGELPINLISTNTATVEIFKLYLVEIKSWALHPQSQILQAQ